MKTLTYKLFSLIVVLLLTAGFNAQAQVERSKTVNKTFNVKPTTQLEVVNRYGDIHIDTWDKNQMVIKVEILVRKGSERRAEELLDGIDIDITGGDNSSAIRLVTKINTNVNFKGNEQIKIDYDIKMPVSGPININNKYGHFYLSKTNAKADINVSYGKVRIDEINAEANLDLAYGGGEIEKLGGGYLDLSYSNLYLGNAGNMEIDSRYSKLEIDKIKSLELTKRYGSLEIDELESITGSSKYSEIKVDEVTKSIDMSLSYGGGFTARSISKSFTKIAIDSDYITVNLTFEAGANAKVNAYARYGNIRFDDNQFTFNYQVSENNSKEFRGKMGTAQNPSSTIDVSSKYGSINLDVR